MLAWYLLEVALNALLYYSSSTYDDWYYLYLLVPHSLALYLEIYILAHIFSSLLLDTVVTGTATSIIRHLSKSFSCIMMSGLLHEMCLSVLTWWFHRMVGFSFSITHSGLCWYQCCASTLIA